MTVELDLSPELEQQARARAAAYGMSLEAYLLSVIKDAFLPATPAEVTLEEFEANMDAFSAGTGAVHAEWRRLLVLHAVTGVQVHDTRIAATMSVHGVTHLLTFNGGDFARFAGVTARHPRDI